MSVRRLSGIPGFGIDRVAAAAGADPSILRMENLDTDVPPHPAALAATRDAVSRDDANSWLPFTGKPELAAAVAAHYSGRSGAACDADGEVCITCGEGDAMLNALLTTTDPGDEVVLWDPTYAGMINRVRLAGAVPRLVPFEVVGDEWRMDLDALRSTVNERTRAVFFANPCMPSGALLNDEEWRVLVEVCAERSLWVLYLAWMEAILFDGRQLIHPASFPALRDRVVTIGTVSMEQRMIGWRIGWTIAPASLTADLKLVHIYNGLVAGGIAQAGALAALQAPPDDVTRAVEEWEQRRNVTLEQLAGLPVVRPAGGWSALLDVAALGLAAPDVSLSLIEQKVAATPMTAWGDKVAPRYVRFVYSNEPVERLALLGDRARQALGV